MTPSSPPHGPNDRRPHKLRRAKAKLRKKLRAGFARVVFAAPGPEGAQEVHESGEGPLNDEAFERWFALAEAAAAAGRVKHSWVIDDRTRVDVDARHGFPKSRVLDEARVEKVMGGKDRPLRPDRSAALLRTIGIMNADGSIPARRAKKYKQVNHLVELLRPTLDHLEGHADEASDAAPLRVVDLACGNGYLSFVLAEVLRLEGREAAFHGVDGRADLVERCRARASELAFANMRFDEARIREHDAEGGERVDLVLALHACDTATDEAIAWGMRRHAPAIFVVPCCQAELARQLAQAPSPSSTASNPSPLPDALLAHGRLRRGYADLLTDALRVACLEAAGYEVAVLEFVSTEHTAKNTLIRAHRRRGASTISAASFSPIEAQCAAQGLDFALLRELAAAFG